MVEEYDQIAAPNFDLKNASEIFQLRGSSIERKSGTSSDPDQIFWRRIIWSPDGTHLLAHSDDHHVDMFRLLPIDTEPESFELQKVFSLRAPTTLLAMEWYPFARCDDAASWCFIISARGVPVRLIDAYEGRSRASYGIIDHIERFIGPQALAFSMDGTKLYCGLDSEIATFDLTCPGTNTHVSLKLAPSRRAVTKGKVSAGQRGQISCLAVATDHFAGTGEELIAVGTYAGSVGLYTTNHDGHASAEDYCLLGWSEGSEGVAQVSFHPAALNILFVTTRRSNEIRAYDLQYIGSRRSFLHRPERISLLATFDRTTNSRKETQQKMHFHLDWAGRYLLAGDGEGAIKVWDVTLPSASQDQAAKSEDEHFFGKLLRGEEDAARQPMSRLQAARDAVTSANFHPTLPFLAVASGARQWVAADSDLDHSQGHYVQDGSLRLFSAKA